MYDRAILCEIAYLEGETLWIINEQARLAYETRQYDDGVPPNGIFISHDMTDRHSTSILEIKQNAQEVEVPKRFYSLI